MASASRRKHESSASAITRRLQASTSSRCRTVPPSYTPGTSLRKTATIARRVASGVARFQSRMASLRSISDPKERTPHRSCAGPVGGSTLRCEPSKQDRHGGCIVAHSATTGQGIPTGKSSPRDPRGWPRTNPPEPKSGAGPWNRRVGTRGDLCLLLGGKQCAHRFAFPREVQRVDQRSGVLHLSQFPTFRAQIDHGLGLRLGLRLAHKGS